ncbi:MAG: hypothetical protein WAR22_13770 [Desulfomonilia bacterium]
MSRKKSITEAADRPAAGVPAPGRGRDERFRFGEATIRLGEVDVNTWQCSVQGRVIGFVVYSPEYRFKNDGRGKDYGYRAFCCDSIEHAEEHPATEVNAYPSLKSAARAVVACHFGGRRYTYVHDNVVILEGRVVHESVLKGRKVIEPLLEP